MSQINENQEFAKILSNMNFDELNITYSFLNDQQDGTKELLGVDSAPADDLTGTTGMAPQDGDVGIHIWDWTRARCPLPLLPIDCSISSSLKDTREVQQFFNIP